MLTFHRATIGSVQVGLADRGMYPSFSFKTTIKDSTLTASHCFSGVEGHELLRQGKAMCGKSLEGRECLVVMHGIFMQFYDFADNVDMAALEESECTVELNRTFFQIDDCLGNTPHS